VPLSGDTVFVWNAIEGGGYAARFATNEPFAGLFEALAARSPGAGQATYNDSAREIFRAALILDERLDAAVFFGREGEVPPWSGLAEVWRLERLDATARRFLLAGRTASTSFDASPTICACFGVKSQAILSAIADGARSTGDWRAAQCRHELRIMPSRPQADDRGRAGSAKSQRGPVGLESGSFHDPHHASAHFQARRAGA
jgi:hypothetical protein